MNRTPDAASAECRKNMALGRVARAMDALGSETSFPVASSAWGSEALQDEIMRQLPGSWQQGGSGAGGGRPAGAGASRPAGGGLPLWAARVVRQVRMISITKAKPHHMAHMIEFMALDAAVAAGGTHDEAATRAKMAELAKGMCRQLLIPSGWDREGQRMGIAHHRAALVAALEGIEFSALTKGGAACRPARRP